MTPEEIQQAANEAGISLEALPRVPVYLQGPMPHGGVWCATCSVLWLGFIGKDANVRKMIRKQSEADAKDGASASIFVLPETDDKAPILQLAMTVGPSIYSHTPMPVCWTHLLPFTFPTKEEQAEMQKRADSAIPPTLIPGKRYWSGPGGF